MHSAPVPVLGEKIAHLVDLVALVLSKLGKRHGFLLTGWQRDQVSLVVILLSPDPHEFEGSLTADAEIL